MIDELIKEQVFQYLDELRESGITNMYGARPYIQEEFGFSTTESTEYLAEWMRTFEERHSENGGE